MNLKSMNSPVLISLVNATAPHTTINNNNNNKLRLSALFFKLLSRIKTI